MWCDININIVILVGLGELLSLSLGNNSVSFKFNIKKNFKHQYFLKFNRYMHKCRLRVWLNTKMENV